MKIFAISLFIVFMIFSLNSCAHYSYDSKSLLGISIKDLEAARSNGIEKNFSMPYSELFTTVKTILEQNNLTIYQLNMEKKYIISMGFEQQVTTTRVGIFFDVISESETRITLSSLSSTTLKKAEEIIFGNLPE